MRNFLVCPSIIPTMLPANNVTPTKGIIPLFLPKPTLLPAIKELPSELKGFAKYTLKYTMRLEIEFLEELYFRIFLTPSLLAETTRSMLNPKYVKLVMTVDFTKRIRQYSLPARDIRRRTKRALDMANLPAWPAAFSSVKITLGITFEVRHHRRLAPDGSDDKDEALPGCFKTSIGLVEERIGKKTPLERPPGWRQIHGLRYSWTAEATSALDFSGKKSAQEGVATEPPSLTWCLM
ncbi:hypothetical protein V8E51_000714 [Hyaloscypha variabilis]